MLFDIDKNNDDRGSPSPNRHDQILQEAMMAKQTLSTSYTTSTPTTQNRISMKNNLIVTYDSSNRVSSIYGYIPTVSSAPVLIIAKAGYDVFTDVLGIARPAGL